MNKINKIMAIGAVFIVGIITTIIFVVNNLYDYLIVAFPFTVIMAIWFIYEIINHNLSEEDSYNKTLSKITRVYDPILVNTNTFPKLNNKSILYVNNFNDLVDAQAEIRKPIYFIIGSSSTAFYLINDDVFLIYFLKINNNIETELEIELKRVELQSSLNLDAIKDFDKTVVIQTNNKAYKVSPIREKKEDNIATQIVEKSTSLDKLDNKEYKSFIRYYNNLVSQNTDFSNLTNRQKNRFETLITNLKEATDNFTKSITEEEKNEVINIIDKLKLDTSKEIK